MRSNPLHFGTEHLASVWAERGRAAMEKTAIDRPTVFFATCALLIGPAVKLMIEQSLPGNLPQRRGLRQPDERTAPHIDAGQGHGPFLRYTYESSSGQGSLPTILSTSPDERPLKLLPMWRRVSAQDPDHRWESENAVTGEQVQK